MRLIDADALKFKNVAEVNGYLTHILTGEEIDNAPTVEISKIEYKAYNEGFKDGVEQGIRLSDRPQGKWSRYKRRCRMSNDKLNDAIKTIKKLCEVQKTCIECPMNCNCGNCPKDWEEEKNNA